MPKQEGKPFLYRKLGIKNYMKLAMVVDLD
jgi:hypothetical protein